MTEEAASQAIEPENTPAPDPGNTGDSPEVQGTPAESAPETDWQAEAQRLQERYDNLQPEYTRASQRAAQLEQIMDAARRGDPEALDYLGLDLADTGDDPELPPDETERLDRLEQQFAQQAEAAQQAEQQARIEAAANAFYDEEFTRLDPQNEWDDEYRQLVASVADGYPDEDGLPNLEQAHQAIQARFEADFKKRVQAKRNASKAPSGAAPSQNIDLNDPEQRREWMHSKLQEAESAADV